MELLTYTNELAITKLPTDSPLPNWALNSKFINIFKNDEEFSIVSSCEALPSGLKTERGWYYFKIQGEIPFQQTGVLCSVLAPLAAKEIGIFALSTFNTDYILVKIQHFEMAKIALRESGHTVT